MTPPLAKSMTHVSMTYVCFTLVAFIWGTTWMAIKYSLFGFPPLLGATLRFVVAIAVLALYARVKRIRLALPREMLGYIIATSVLLYVVDYGLIYWGEQYLNSGVTAILFAALPLMTTLISAFAFKSELFSYRKFVGILVGLAGIVVVFFDQLVVTNFNGQVLLASAAILTAAIAAAISVVIAKKHLMKADTVALTLNQLLWGTLLLGVIAAVRGEWAHIHFSITATLALLYLGLVGSALAFVLYYQLLRSMSASSLVTINYITPVIAVLIGWLLLDESITVRAMLGTLTIFLGITIIQLEHLPGLLRVVFIKRDVKSAALKARRGS